MSYIIFIKLRLFNWVKVNFTALKNDHIFIYFFMVGASPWQVQRRRQWVEVGSSFYCVGPSDLIQVVRFGGKPLYSLSILANSTAHDLSMF